jgi:hypothetical protein
VFHQKKPLHLVVVVRALQQRQVQASALLAVVGPQPLVLEGVLV